MIKHMTTIAIAASFCLCGPMLVELPFKPIQELSFLDVAYAARPAVHRRAHRTARPVRGRTRVDVDVDGRGRARNVDVDVDRYGRHRNVDIDVDRRPAVGAVAVGAALVGTRVATLPGSCTRVVANTVTYHNCNGVYYRPYYQGNEVVYVVVDKP